MVILGGTAAQNLGHGLGIGHCQWRELEWVIWLGIGMGHCQWWNESLPIEGIGMGCLA